MQNLFKFIKKHHQIFLFLLLEGIALSLIVQNSYFQSSAILAWSGKQSGRLYSMSNAVSDYFSLAEANRLLSEENAALRERIENSYIQYTNRKFSIKDTIYKQQYEYIEAKIVSNSFTKRNNYLILNKGSRHGIKPDMAVIAPDGIVGNVINVTENFSNVMSVLHSDARHSVTLKKTNSAGMLVWEGPSYRKGIIENVPSNYPVEKGDTIITSGFSQDFPKGIFVGTVFSYDKNQSTGFYTIHVKFSTDYNTLDHVYIVKNLFKEEQLELIKSREENE